MFGLLFISMLFVGCAQSDIEELNGVNVELKKVSISADMGDETRASLDSTTGAFTWQNGDVISVLATDGKFYDFTLTGEAGDRTAEFVGEIPQTAAVTTVATYPALVANGTENAIYSNGVLNYTLPAEWSYVEGTCNVPMAASFEQGATHMAFKQIGGVLRFPVKNLPLKATFVVTFNDATVTGAFPVEVATLGQAAITATEGTSTVAINYTSDIYGQNVEFNVPVPVGTYNDFTVTINGANGEAIFTKEYKKDETRKDNVVERASLIVMKDIAIPESPLAISEVWPFFVDARVLFSPVAEATQYAFFIDGEAEPVIVDLADLETREDGRVAVLIGGNFEHDTAHTVAVAKVINGTVVTASKSEAKPFATGKIRQMTYNTGTKFVCAAWDDVAIGVENSPVYNETTQRWSIMKRNTALTPRDVRGYRVQLYAADKTTKLYDEVPFSGQVDYGGAFCDSSWFGRIEGENVMLPSALTFGWLEPNKKYYIRVQTLAEPVVFDSPANGYFKPNGTGVTMTSLRGGCAWSNFVELTTDAPHVPTDREVLYEGFDDMMFNSDIMNAAPAAVPQILTTATSDDDYKTTASAALYKAWAALPFEQRKFSEQGFNTMLSVEQYGLSDDADIKDTPRYLNSYAGSLEGWSVFSGKANTRSMHPNFGSVRLGESGTASGKTELRTKPINSDKLSATVPTKCIVRIKVSAHATTQERVNRVLGVYHYREANGALVTIDNKNTIDFSLNSDGTVKQDWRDNFTWTDNKNYTHYPVWFDVTTEINLLKGDILGFEKANPKVDNIKDYYKGCVTIGEISIEVVPEDTGEGAFVDNGIGTEPDDTNYDVYGLGEFPISYWYTVEPSFYIDYTTNTYSHELTKAKYQEVKDAGFNIALYYGHHIDCSIAENKRIHDVCAEVGLKFIGRVAAADTATRMQLIKETFGNSDTYVGELIDDEPGADLFDEIGTVVDAFNAAMPNKEAYINLFPQYANAATQLKTDYENYIDSYLQKVHTKSLSYDFYGLRSNTTTVFNTFFSNFDLVRDKTLRRRMPFWVITQACQAPSCRMPNRCEQRWSVWANIAGGSKGIAYFCYGSPTGSDWVSLIDFEGNKTDMYYWVQEINKDINTIGKKLLPCHADGAIMTATTYYPLWVNSGTGRTKYGPIQKVSGDNSILCGCFRDARRSENGPNYMGYKALVLSEMPNRTVNAYLTLDPSVTQITFTHNNTTETVALSSTLSTTVGGITITYDSSYKLSLTIPDGEAVLLEF